MSRLSTGDRSAFEPLFHALHPRALRLARARIVSSAEDVAQDALLKVFANAHRFVPGRPALPWFYGIVGNEIHAAARRARRTTPTDAVDRYPAPAEDAEQALLRRELLTALEQAVESLDDAAAQVIRAQLGQGERPQLESTTFRKRVSRAYARLRLLLGELG